MALQTLCFLFLKWVAGKLAKHLVHRLASTSGEQLPNHRRVDRNERAGRSRVELPPIGDSHRRTGQSARKKKDFPFNCNVVFVICL